MKPIKTGLASYGMSGQVFHAPFLEKSPGFSLAACVERSKDLIRGRYPHVLSVCTFDELLKVPDLELVVVNTPDVTHYSYVKAALEAGKHVVVEKPFVSTLAQAEELTALAQRLGLLLTVYQNRRLDGDFRTIRQLVEQGALGRVIEYNASFERFREVNAASWKDSADGRVGLLYNLGSHSIDQAMTLLGMPEAIWCTTDITRKGGQVIDYFQVVMRYPRCRVNLRASMRIKEMGSNFAVHGDEGSYVVHYIDPQEALLKEGAVPGGEGWGEVSPEEWGVLNNGDGRRQYPTVRGDYGLYYENIYDCLRNGAEPDVTHAQMLGLMRLLEAAVESAATGCEVRL